MSFNTPSYVDDEKIKDSNMFWKQVKRKQIVSQVQS